MRRLISVKSPVLTAILALALAGILVAILSPTPSYAIRCEDGWAQVCCGPQCSIGGVQGDYCIGSGTYCCCK